MNFFLCFRDAGKGTRIKLASMLSLLALIMSLHIYGQETGEITVLETDNSFPGYWCAANDGYLYGLGVSQKSTILRKRENGQGYETRGSVTALNPAFQVENRIYSTSTPGLIFVLVRDEQSRFSLLKSHDGGMTFRQVFKFGEGNGPDGSDAADVRLLRGLLELTRDLPGGGGRGTLFIGEYNINKTRTVGSVNDRIRIMKSEDQGETWQKVVEWNTNGANQVGHIHAMRQDPFTGYVYICTGDYNSKIGIIKWDGESQWPDNRQLPQIIAMNGFDGFSGLQRYRTCDVLFDENYFYTFADTQTPNNQSGSESGIWRGRKDFSSFVRMDNQIFSYDPMHIGWFGEKIGDTFIFTTAREYEGAFGWRELNTEVYLSNDGIKWHKVGVLNWRDNGNPLETRYIVNVFSYNNKLYIDCYAGAGHSATIQCSLTRSWKTVDEPVILHPVFFVGRWNNNGRDAAGGANADSPKATLSNLLSGNRISLGSRIRVSKGTLNEPEIHPLWASPMFQGRGKVVIEGQGKDSTLIARSSNTRGSYGLKLEAARTLTGTIFPLVLKDLGFYITSDGLSDPESYLLHNADSYIRTENCRIGSLTNNISSLVFLEKPGAGYFSENTIHTASIKPGNEKQIVKINSQGTRIHLKNSLILNAYNAFVIDFPETELILRNCTFFGIGNNGLYLGEGNNSQPVVKNNIFSCGAYPINDNSGITETQVDYNLYNRNNRNVSDGSNGPPVGTDPGFRDPVNGDFELRSDSHSAMHGTWLTDILYDLTGKSRYDPPCLGAYECLALNATPGEIGLGAESGAWAELVINSNTEWQVEDIETWVALSSNSGKGSIRLLATALTSNEEEVPRESRLRVTAPGTIAVYVNIIQASKATEDTEETEDIEDTEDTEDAEETESDNEVTSETRIEILKFRFFPNPVSDYLTIEVGDEQFKSFYLLNSKGEIIMKEPIDGTMQKIDLSRLAGGMYILELVSPANRSKRIKVIKL